MERFRKAIFRIYGWWQKKSRVRVTEAREKSIKYAHVAHHTKYERDYIEIDEIVGGFRESGGLKHDYQSYKLWHLKQLLSKYRPLSILEFGSGSSTMLFAKYVRNNEDSRLLSLDEDEKWVINTKKLINFSPEDRIDVRFAKKVFVSTSIPTQIKYDIEIEDYFDFVLVDGPSLQVNGEKKKDAVNTNVLDLQQYPKIIVVDVRRATAEHLSHMYHDNYDVSLSDLFSGKPVKSDYHYFSVFTKK